MYSLCRLCGFDLPHGLEEAKLGERVGRNMLIAEQVRDFGTDAGEQVSLGSDLRDVHVEHTRQPLFGNTAHHVLPCASQVSRSIIRFVVGWL
jgi:hypothetical protein